MNKVVLIGNGFDKAHKMETSYQEFIIHYLRNSMQFAFENQWYSDENIELTINKTFFIEDLLQSDNLRFILESSFQISPNEMSEIIQNGIPIQERIYHNKSILINYKNTFLRELLSIDNEYWYNIEQFYYRKLKHGAQRLQSIEQNNYIRELNSNFGKIKALLSTYLSSLDKPSVVPQLMGILLSTNAHEISNNFPKILYENSLYLNFNYTDTLSLYIQNTDNSENPIINIHGQISEGNLIFGYGDEVGDDYSLIENLDQNEFLMNVKSFGYLQNSNYENLFKFLQRNLFEIFIVGHSCALTDRTLLNRLFEHRNCRKIRVFYHKIEADIDDYSNIIYNISRSFRDKHTMRTKVCSKDKCIPLPQKR